jgi:hypothetical protein
MGKRNLPAELDDFDEHEECWECHGDGVYYDCFEEYACIDPEGGCSQCERRCQACKGVGHFPVQDDSPRNQHKDG